MAQQHDDQKSITSRETNPYKTGAAPWTKKNDGAKATSGGPTSGGKIKR